jgi:hypothetical protein
MACTTSARLLIAHRPFRLVRSPSRTRRVGGPTLKFLNAHRARGRATTFYVSSQSAMVRQTLIVPLLMTALCRTANAEEGALVSPSKPAVTEADQQRLQWVLDTASTKARWGRERSAAFDGVLLAVVVPPGVILSTRADAGLQMAGVGVLASGYWPLVGLLTSFFPSDMEALQARYEMRKASGADPAVVVRETEDDFRQLAARHRGPRPWLVAIDLLFGGGLAAYGSYLLLSDPPVSRTDMAYGVLLFEVGAPLFVSGIFGLFPQPESPAEHWWHVYQFGTPPRAPAAAIGPTLSVAPIAHGAAAEFHLSF